MNLADAKVYAMDVLFSADHADLITYNGSPIYGHITYGGRNAPTAKHATLTVRVSDVPDPQYRDTVIVGSTTWRVFQDQSQDVIIAGDGLTWEIPLIRDEKPRAF
ncbi:hypothetical protein [Desulfosarcina ovata]|uniref:Uncharacterized protein n=1 Tax=Desulfosarcina ovata subsp. ovata TaxID=2752305 RepID=A0A5K8AHA0_9BACT|nr:hypothetical protein [Desulfosarcina ovata]BBO92055.1 hypothetical protein DSCOOX_52350 [Desulfosarcina ovata subsp. ovata]